jgi:F-type H+-transporting ATPase subunit delta
MIDTTVASRYAVALFSVTEKRGETERALTELQGLAGTIAAGTRVGALLRSPLVLLSDKRKVVLQVLENRALKSVALFVDLLLRKKRLGEFDGIVEQFEARVERKQGIRRAHLTSAVPLTADEESRLLRELERYTQSKIKLTREVDPRLIGGAQVRIGDRVIDRSVRTLLDTIEEQLMELSV